MSVVNQDEDVAAARIAIYYKPGLLELLGRQVGRQAGRQES